MVTPNIIIPLGSRIFVEHRDKYYQVSPRHITGLFRDGRITVVYDVDTVDRGKMESDQYVGTYFSVFEALEKGVYNAKGAVNEVSY